MRGTGIVQVFWIPFGGRSGEPPHGSGLHGVGDLVDPQKGGEELARRLLVEHLVLVPALGRDHATRAAVLARARLEPFQGRKRPRLGRPIALLGEAGPARMPARWPR